MSSQFEQAREHVRQRVSAIAAAGEHVRAQVAATVAEAAQRFPSQLESFVGLCRSAVDGAADAVAKSLPRESDSVLREVSEGLGDGLTAAAQATQLALQEAAGQGKRFAEEDLRRAADELGSLGEMFVQLVRRTAAGARSETGARLADLESHARNTAARIRPHLEAAARAARQDAGRLGREVASTGLRASSLAVGALFSAVGGLMQRAGGRSGADPVDPDGAGSGGGGTA